MAGRGRRPATLPPSRTGPASGATGFRSAPCPAGLPRPRAATARRVEEDPRPDRASCGDPCHHLVCLWDLAPNHLLELALDTVRMLETDLARDLGDNVSMDAVVPIAELNIEASAALGMRLHDGANARGELSVAGCHVLARHDLRLHRLEMDVDARHLRQLGANRPFQRLAGARRRGQRLVPGQLRMHREMKR